MDTADFELGVLKLSYTWSQAEDLPSTRLFSFCKVNCRDNITTDSRNLLKIYKLKFTDYSLVESMFSDMIFSLNYYF